MRRSGCGSLHLGFCSLSRSWNWRESPSEEASSSVVAASLKLMRSFEWGCLHLRLQGPSRRRSWWEAWREASSSSAATVSCPWRSAQTGWGQAPVPVSRTASNIGHKMISTNVASHFLNHHKIRGGGQNFGLNFVTGIYDCFNPNFCKWAKNQSNTNVNSIRQFDTFPQVLLTQYYISTYHIPLPPFLNLHFPHFLSLFTPPPHPKKKKINITCARPRLLNDVHLYPAFF